MTRHPLDQNRTFNDEERAAKYSKIARESGPDGSHPAAKAALKRPQAKGKMSEIARAKKAGAA